MAGAFVAGEVRAGRFLVLRVLQDESLRIDDPIHIAEF